MTNKKRKYLNKLFNFALTNNSDDFHIFIEFHGHVDLISIRVNINGWSEEKSLPDYSTDFYLSSKEEFKTESILKKLIELKNEPQPKNQP